MRFNIVRLMACLVSLLLAVTMSACTSESDGTDAETRTRGVAESDPTPSPPPPDPRDVLLEQIRAETIETCPSWAPEHENIGYTDLTGDAARVYSEVLVCSNGVDSFLTNESDGVWEFDRSVSGFYVLQYGANSEFFRESGVIPVGTNYMAPGDSVAIANMTTIRWHPSTALTAVWATQEFGLDHAKAFGAAYVAATVKRSTGHSTAIPQCMLATYQLMERAGELDQTSALVDRLQTALKATGTATCATAMQKADRNAQTPGFPPPHRKMTWKAHVNTLSGQVDDGLEVGKYLDFAVGVCKILPRGC